MMMTNRPMQRLIRVFSILNRFYTRDNNYLYTGSEASIGSDESEGKDWSDLEEEARNGMFAMKYI